VPIPLKLPGGNDLLQAKRKNLAFGPPRLRGRRAGDRRRRLELDALHVQKNTLLPTASNDRGDIMLSHRKALRISLPRRLIDRNKNDL
jgi:hypothetical protein